jgi:hypothetical protein
MQWRFAPSTSPGLSRMSEIAVRSTLHQCGLEVPDIEEFIRDAKS